MSPASECTYVKSNMEGGSNIQYYGPLILARVTIYLATFSYNISAGHFLPCITYCLVLACIKAFFHIWHLRFCHDLANI
jgi:hypothetical protein